VAVVEQLTECFPSYDLAFSRCFFAILAVFIIHRDSVTLFITIVGKNVECGLEPDLLLATVLPLRTLSKTFAAMLGPEYVPCLLLLLHHLDFSDGNSACDFSFFLLQYRQALFSSVFPGYIQHCSDESAVP
jgi:hypothetical protein